MAADGMRMGPANLFPISQVICELVAAYLDDQFPPDLRSNLTSTLPALPQQLADLTAQYKARLSGVEGQRAFVQLVKQVARIEPGSKYLVLKE